MHRRWVFFFLNFTTSAVSQPLTCNLFLYFSHRIPTLYLFLYFSHRIPTLYLFLYFSHRIPTLYLFLYLSHRIPTLYFFWYFSHCTPTVCFLWKKIRLYHVRQAEKPYYHASRWLTSGCGFQQCNRQTRGYWVQQDIDHKYIS